jgi:tRNA A37 threonylcarbamoyladenosine modification protein TsaB
MSSLALVARTAIADPVIAKSLAGATLAVAMDARQGMLFFQAFGAADRQAIDEPALLLPAEAGAMLVADPVLAVGSAASMLVAALRARDHAASFSLPDLLPDARWTSALDLARAESPRPVYLRQPDARPQTGASLPRATT